MSNSIAWRIPCDVIEQAMKYQNHLEGPVTVWGAGFDETANQVIVVMEIEDEDIEAILVDPLSDDGRGEFVMMEDGDEQLQ